MAIKFKTSTASEHRNRALSARHGAVATNWMVSIGTLLVVLVFPLDAWTATSIEGDARRIDERALLSWATHLSRYETDRNLPQVRYEPHRFFVEHACLGRESCRVLGWYDDRDIIFIDEALSPMNSLFERSLLVHEFVHVLQHRSGRFDDHDCEKFVEREREAYAVQQAFFVAHGAVPTVRARHYSCTASTINASTASISESDGALKAAHSQQASKEAGEGVEASVVNPM